MLCVCLCWASVKRNRKDRRVPKSSWKYTSCWPRTNKNQWKGLSMPNYWSFHKIECKSLRTSSGFRLLFASTGYNMIQKQIIHPNQGQKRANLLGINLVYTVHVLFGSKIKFCCLFYKHNVFLMHIGTVRRTPRPAPVRTPSATQSDCHGNKKPRCFPQQTWRCVFRRFQFKYERVAPHKITATQLNGNERKALLRWFSSLGVILLSNACHLPTNPKKQMASAAGTVFCVAKPRTKGPKKLDKHQTEKSRIVCTTKYHVDHFPLFCLGFKEFEAKHV